VSQCCAGVCTDITTDQGNCGTCGQNCGFGVCQSSTCLTPVTLATAPSDKACAIAVSATHVYWAVGGDIMSVPIGGGTPVVVTSGVGCALAVDATNLYWTGDSTIMKAPLGGGSPVTLASGQSLPSYLAVTDGTVYWINYGTAPNYTNGTAMKVPAAGGTVTQIAASGISQPESMAASALNVYWTNYNSGALMQVPVGGGAPTEAASGNVPYGIATDTANVYWSDFYSGLIVELPLAGGTAVTLASDAGDASSLAVDATSVYWVTSDALGKVHIGGGATTVLANAGFGGLSLTQGVAVDATSVYWIADLHTIDGILKIPK
jgi:hypothetical protein